MYTKSLYVNGENGCIFINHPSENKITFCVNLPIKNGNVANVVTAVKHDGRYLQDIDNAKVSYHREKMEDVLRVVATLEFPDGIPEDYLFRLTNYMCEEFIVEYHEEAIVEVK